MTQNHAPIIGVAVATAAAILTASSTFAQCDSVDALVVAHRFASRNLFGFVPYLLLFGYIALRAPNSMEIANHHIRYERPLLLNRKGVAALLAGCAAGAA